MTPAFSIAADIIGMPVVTSGPKCGPDPVKQMIVLRAIGGEWTSISEITKSTGLSIKEVTNATQKLVSKGLIERDPSRYHNAQYRRADHAQSHINK